MNKIKYFGATLSEVGSCTVEILIMAAAMARLDRIWRSTTIMFAAKLQCSLFNYHPALRIRVVNYADKGGEGDTSI